MLEHGEAEDAIELIALEWKVLARADDIRGRPPMDLRSDHVTVVARTHARSDIEEQLVRIVAQQLNDVISIGVTRERQSIGQVQLRRRRGAEIVGGGAGNPGHDRITLEPNAGELGVARHPEFRRPSPLHSPLHQSVGKKMFQGIDSRGCHVDIRSQV